MYYVIPITPITQPLLGALTGVVPEIEAQQTFYLYAVEDSLHNRIITREQFDVLNDVDVLHDGPGIGYILPSR